MKNTIVLPSNVCTMNIFEKCYCSIFKRISNYAYIFRVEPGGAFVCECVTEAFTSITGYTLEEVNARGGWLSLIYPEDKPIFIKQLDRLFLGQSNVSEFRIVTKSGEVRWLCDYAQPVWGTAQGRVIRIYGTAQDITGHKQDEETIRDPESVYYRILETAFAAFK